MKIYFAGSITGGRNYESVYQVIVDYLKHLGHTILTEHVAYPSQGYLKDYQEVFKSDMLMLNNSDLLIAEVSCPSTGVGYEVASALYLDKPVLCLYKEGVEISSLIKGNTKKKISVYSYLSETELLNIIKRYLNEFPE